MIAAKNLWLRITEPDSPPREIPVVEGMVFGRLPEIDCPLNDPKVSNRHAQVVRSGDGLAVEDLGSTNKTRIEEGPELSAGDRHRLTEGLAFWLGRTRLLVIRAAPASVVAPIEAPSPDVTLMARQMRDDERSRSGPAESGPIDEPTLDAPARSTAFSASSSRSQRTDEAEGRSGTEKLGGRTTIQVGGSAGGRSAEPGLVTPERVAPPRSRLVLASDGERRALDLQFPATEDAELVIGRSRNAGLPFTHVSVSASHARFVCKGPEVWFEDLGSTNGSSVDEVPVQPPQAVRLSSDQLLRLGSVECLFIRNADDRGLPIPEERYETALERLKRRGKLNEDEFRRSLVELGERRSHPGETLVLAGRITPAEWVEAIRGDRLSGPKRSGRPRALVFLLGVIIVLLVAYLAWSLWG